MKRLHRKASGVLLLLLGVVILITPFTFGSPVVFALALRFLGVRIPFVERMLEKAKARWEARKKKRERK